MTQTETAALAIALVAINNPSDAEAAIRALHGTEVGAEMLRLIVRDNLAGAGDIITSALWDNL